MSRNRERSGIFQASLCLWVFTCLIPVAIHAFGHTSALGSAKIARVKAGAKPSPVQKFCQEIFLNGEISAGKEWSAPIGEGWVFRVFPISTPKSVEASRQYSGWDLVVDRATGGGFPDALMLATPPYDSLNEREIGTTFGMRAQDALGWTPRRFRFFTAPEALARGQMLYGELMNPKKEGRSGKVESELLALIQGSSQGEFRVIDARLRLGIADPPPFARQWADHLGHLQYQVLQGNGGADGRGALAWMRFQGVLWMPKSWRLPAGSTSRVATCIK